VNFDATALEKVSDELGLGTLFFWRQVDLLLEVLGRNDDLALELVTIPRVLL
jgi:hypothetical protein